MQAVPSLKKAQDASMDTSSYGSHRDHRLRTWLITPWPPPRKSCDTWVQMLIEYRDQAEAAIKAASVHCDDARRTLATALLERARAGIALELDLLAWKANEHGADASIGCQAGPVRGAGPAETRDGHPRFCSCGRS
jgi:hypothetical protein